VHSVAVVLAELERGDRRDRPGDADRVPDLEKNPR
jgi:hypothetical protein